jgi:hypothetical protein
MQLRFLQTVAEVATEKNSTLVMPIPVELLGALGRLGGGAGPDDGRPAVPPPLPPAPPSEAGEPARRPPATSGPDDGRAAGDDNGRRG